MQWGQTFDPGLKVRPQLSQCSTRRGGIGSWSGSSPAVSTGFAMAASTAWGTAENLK